MQLSRNKLQNWAGNLVRLGRSPNLSPNLKGVGIVMLASLILSFQNIVVRVVLSEQTVLGFTFGGFISSRVGNLLLILLLRMLLVVPVMAGIGTWLYPPLWSDLKKLLRDRNLALLGGVLGSGLLLFLSLPLMFTALSVIPAGVATTLFFVYPTVTVLFAWWFFGDRPTPLLAAAVGTIYAGCLLTIPDAQQSTVINLWLGVTMAILAGVVFAAYTILTQVCAQQFRLHPVPFTLGVFVTMLLLAGLTVGAIASLPWLANTVPGLQIEVDPQMWLPLWGSTVILTLTAIAGFLLNNIGIRMIGAAQTAIISASGPVFTTLLGWLLIQEALQSTQAIGILLVTLWVGAIGAGVMKSPKSMS